MRTCNICFLEKQETEFYRYTTGKKNLMHRCKQCHLDKGKERRRNNIEEHNARQRIYNSKRPEEHKFRNRLKSRYNLSLTDYNELLSSQENKCAICKTSISELSRGLFIDHNHDTNKVRGLLCQYCNSGLGNFKDNEEFLKSAIEYLSTTPS